MRHLLFIALIAASTQASAQVVPRDSAAQSALTIDQAIELARRNNPVLQQTLNNRIGARAAVRSAYGALLPTADASLSAQRQQGGQQIFSGTSLGASSDVNQSSYQIGFNYRINSATLITPSLQRANRDAVEADITGATETLRSNVAQQYLLSFAAVRIDSSILDYLTRKLLALPLSYFNNRRTGDIQRRLDGARQVRQFFVQQGIGGPKKDMAVLMNINHNGQAISLSKTLADKGAVDGPSLAKVISRSATFCRPTTRRGNC